VIPPEKGWYKEINIVQTNTVYENKIINTACTK
jgi:hypothetical protein